MKSKINRTQQNSKYRLCGDKNKLINYIISKHSKLAQIEYQSKDDREEKMIYKELCKWLEFDPSQYIIDLDAEIRNCPRE